MDGRRRHLGRREFLQRGAWLGLGVPLASVARAEEPPTIERRSKLGRTGIEVPDISFGGWGLPEDPDLVRYALERGVTHFDTASKYEDGRSEETLGRGLRGLRQRATIATKSKVFADTSADEIMAQLEKSLRRLQTDYVDLYFNHAVNAVDRVTSPAWPEFVARAKQQGKIRASGMSGHAGRLAECVDVALDENLVDCLLVAYNYASIPGFWEMGLRLKDRFTGGFDLVAYQSEMPRLLAKARNKGVGTLVMKTRRGARYNDLTPFQGDGADLDQAAFRWVLSDPNVDGLVVTMDSRETVDRFVAASGWEPPTAANTRDLLRYEERHAGTLCQQGCGACVDACPAGVEIGEVLRTRMYALDYGRPEVASAEYAGLGAVAAACASCASRDCAAACPSGLAIPDLTMDTHRLLG